MRARLTLVLLSLVLSAVVALTLTACGESKLDTSRLESQIQKSLRERTGVPIESVTCPDDVEARKGDTFRCVATTARKDRVVLDVRQDDSEGRVTWRVAPGPGGKG